MKNLRVSVTAVDSWLYTMRHEDSDVADLMIQLRGEQPQTEPMRVGSAFHKAMEMAELGERISLQANGYVFTVMPDVEIALPAFRELKLESEIELDGIQVTLVGKVDGLHGKTVYDHKTTKRFEAEYMLDTFQWKQYLVMTNADIFQWNCFVLDEGRLSADADGASIWEYQVKDFHILREYRYPSIEADCRELLCEFLAFLGVSRMRFPAPDCTLANLLKANI